MAHLRLLLIVAAVAMLTGQAADDCSAQAPCDCSEGNPADCFGADDCADCSPRRPRGISRHPIAAHRAAWRAQYYNWHGQYAHTAYGQPVALVVPPTARLHTNWSWGTGSSRVSRTDHQFGRNWPGPFGGGEGLYRTPAWPADTHHFGVYHVRAPW